MLTEHEASASQMTTPRRFSCENEKNWRKHYCKTWEQVLKLGMIVFAVNNLNCSGQKNIHDIKMVGRGEMLSRVWAKLRQKIDLQDPTPSIGQVYLGCTQRAAMIDEETIRTRTEMLQRTTPSTADEVPKKKNDSQPTFFVFHQNHSI